MNKYKKKSPPSLIGWEEWCSFPELGLPAIKAKVDTGAKTSCLHAFNIEIIKTHDNPCILFDIHPIQGNRNIVKQCRAPLIDFRYVTNSGGQKEKRYVIQSPLKLGSKSWPIEITLSKRDTMAFRMLLGREAMRGNNLIVNPSKSCLQWKLKNSEAKKLYI